MGPPKIMALKKKNFKIKSVFYVYNYLRIVIKSFNYLPKLIFIIFQYFLKNTKQARKLFFETSTNTLLLSEGNEVFVVSTSDTVIAKSIYVKKKFDLDKFFIAKDILNLNTNNTTFVDIGANIGSICIPLVKRGIVKEAIAIEPDPLNFKLLKSNITLNSLDDKIQAQEKALGKKKNGFIEFELSKVNYGDHRIYNPGKDRVYADEKNRKIIKVETTNLDEILGSTSSNDYFLWSDTQGYEGYILDGSQITLSRGFPFVMEFWPHGMSGSESFNLIKKILFSSPYKYFYDLNDQSMNKIDLNEENLEYLFKKLSNDFNHTDILLSTK